MKKRDKLFFVSYIGFMLVPLISFLLVSGVVKITTFGGSVIMTASLLLVGILFRQWFNDWCDRNNID